MKEYILEPRIIRTEQDLHAERANFAKCPMENVIPCVSESESKPTVHSKDVINHDVNYELFRRIHEPNLLNTNYFSQRNRDNIHNAIRRNVYEISKGKYLIGRQSDQELSNIMRYIYVEHSVNAIDHTNPSLITQQIKFLNNLVIKEAVTKILPSIDFYQYYLQDKFSERSLFDIPKNPSVFGTKTTPFLNRF